MVCAGFEGHKDLGVAHIGDTLGERSGFRVGTTGAGVVAAGDDLIVLHDHAAHEGVGGRAALASTRFAKRFTHKECVAIVVGGPAAHGTGSSSSSECRSTASMKAPISWKER